MRQFLIDDFDIVSNISDMNLPETIQLAQYGKDADNKIISQKFEKLLGSFTYSTITSVPGKFTTPGSLGNGNFEYIIDCRHLSIPYNSET